MGVAFSNGVGYATWDVAIDLHVMCGFKNDDVERYLADQEYTREGE